VLCSPSKGKTAENNQYFEQWAPKKTPSTVLDVDIKRIEKRGENGYIFSLTTATGSVLAMVKRRIQD